MSDATPAAGVAQRPGTDEYSNGSSTTLNPSDSRTPAQ
jgi:hypothetical protein